jgi:4-hydroxybenzoate polyprenyltransferase
MLWFYSVYFKRRALLGNLMVSLLLGIVPIYVMLFNWPIEDISFSNHSLTINLPNNYIIEVVIIISVIAFFQNLVRELIKDIQDIRGDLRLGAATFPIKFGVTKTKILIGVLTSFVVGLMVIFCLFVIDVEFYFRIVFELYADKLFHFHSNNFQLLLFLSLLLFLIATFISLFAKKIKTYKLASTLLKVAMLFGLLTPLFL